MLKKLVALGLLAAILRCSGEGNINLLEDEVTAALKACTHNDSVKLSASSKQRERRWNRNLTDEQYDNNRNITDDQYPRKYNNSKDPNVYSHQRRNTSDMYQNVTNMTKNDLFDYENQNDYGNENFNNTSRIYSNNLSRNNHIFSGRIKRSEKLIKHETDQCLSQCVFANLHVVDLRGIPREADLWNKVQTTVTSQQSRILLQNEIRACFQELQDEAEDNGCSYSNKLEQCLMLGFSDRMKKTMANNPFLNSAK